MSQYAAVTYRFILVYRGSSHEVEQHVRDLIEPFARTPDLWQRFLSSVILIDQDSRVPFTPVMTETFSKFVTAPLTLFSVVHTAVITEPSEIADEFAELFSEFERETSSELLDAFRGIQDQGLNRSWSEAYKPDFITSNMDQAQIEQYVQAVNAMNKNRDDEALKIKPKPAVADTPPQIREIATTTTTAATTTTNNNAAAGPASGSTAAQRAAIQNLQLNFQ